MTVTGHQNDKFTNSYAHYALREATCPTLPYKETLFSQFLIVNSCRTRREARRPHSTSRNSTPSSG